MRLIFKIILLLGLIAYGLSCNGQTHCLSLDRSRKLHEDAVKRYYFEALSDSLSSQVELLQGEKQTIREDYERILSLERENNADLRQKFSNQKDISGSFEAENKHLKKKVRSRTWQRNGLAVLAVIFGGLAVD